MELSSELLRELYLEQRLSEALIAERFGTYQVKIGRLRKKWGIPTLSKTERVAGALPDLTEQQRELIMGSLLGDGWMRASSELAAGFGEGHAVSQSAYTDWKADLLEPFTRSRYHGKKTDGETGKVYHSWSFATACCTQIRPYYDLFYPSPARKRRFPPNLPDLMTPFMLAVWYMDDGNLTERNEPRIAFGLDDRSLYRGLKALSKLGLKPRVYGQGSDQAIHFPKQRMKFRALIETYVPECMTHKLPIETDRQAGDRRARVLTLDKAAHLYRGGLSAEAIAQVYGVGTSTVSRRLKDAGVQKRRSGPHSKKLTREAAEAVLGSFDPSRWSTLTEQEQDRWVREAFQVLRTLGFPFPKQGSVSIAKELSKVRESQMFLEDSRIMPVRRVGIGLCKEFFPNRYRAVSMTKAVSAWESWHRDSDLKRAVRFQFKVGDPVLPHRVLRAVTMNCRTPTVFRPTVARFIYERFLEPGQVTWDPCSGYGGRLLGAVAAGVRYVSTDVDPETVEGNLALAKALGADVSVICCPAEASDPPPVNLVFTSPPYFHQEQYEGGSQSWKKYPGFDIWVDGFLRPMVEKGAKVLLPGGHWVMNIADVKNRKGSFPLVVAARQVMSEVGLTEMSMLKIPLPSLNRKDPWEPVLVFRR